MARWMRDERETVERETPERERVGAGMNEKVRALSFWNVGPVGSTLRRLMQLERWMESGRVNGRKYGRP